MAANVPLYPLFPAPVIKAIFLSFPTCPAAVTGEHPELPAQPPDPTAVPHFLFWSLMLHSPLVSCGLPALDTDENKKESETDMKPSEMFPDYLLGLVRISYSLRMHKNKLLWKAWKCLFCHFYSAQVIVLDPFPNTFCMCSFMDCDIFGVVVLKTAILFSLQSHQYWLTYLSHRHHFSWHTFC